MANNRLYIVDRKSKTRCCLAKTLGDGWWLSVSETRLNAFFDSIDDEASMGNVNSYPTHLDLITENSEEYALFQEFSENAGSTAG